MNRRIPKRIRLFSSKLLLCGIFFVVGCTLGGFVAKHLSGNGYETAAAAIDAMQTGYNERSLDKLAASVAGVYRIPVYMCAVGMTSLAPVLIPALFLAKGFFLTFFFGTCAKIVGGSGVLKALILVMPSELVSLPCLVGLGMMAMTYAGGTGCGINSRIYLNGCVKLLCFTSFSVFADMIISPYLMNLLG